MPFLVHVRGYSMTPTLVDGDRAIVRARRTVRCGDVVLARFRSRPDLLVIKRVSEELVGGWLLSSDNPDAGSDSRTLGPGDVLAVAGWVLRGPTGRRVIGRTGWIGRIPRRIDREAL
jgi:phage repressor protein C with HTH and peptisase S24 domain